MVKLAEKVGGVFEELPFSSRRSLPGVLVNYALAHRVTRIVLGHSKQTLWQELWHGSIVHDMLKRTRSIDIFIVADRAAHEGERILPTKQAKRRKASDLYRRLSSDEVEREIAQLRKGRFKVYIDAAPGVGKT